jgi:hypothetical protein
MSFEDEHFEDLQRVLREGYDTPPLDAGFASGLLERLGRELPARAAPLKVPLRSNRILWRTAGALVAAMLVIGVVIARWPRTGVSRENKTIAQTTQRMLKRDLRESLNAASEPARTEKMTELSTDSAALRGVLMVRSLDAAEAKIVKGASFNELKRQDEIERESLSVESLERRSNGSELIVRARLVARSETGSRWHIDRVLKGRAAQEQLELAANSVPSTAPLQYQAIFFLDRTSVVGDTLYATERYRLDEAEKK